MILKANLESKVADMSVVGSVREVGADKRERLAGIALLDLVDILDTAAIKDIAADSVGRICRVGDHPTLLQGFNDTADKTSLRIVGVNMKQHSPLLFSTHLNCKEL
jgi:hypothetical protein